MYMSFGCTFQVCVFFEIKLGVIKFRNLINFGPKDSLRVTPVLLYLVSIRAWVKKPPL